MFKYAANALLLEKNSVIDKKYAKSCVYRNRFGVIKKNAYLESLRI